MKKEKYSGIITGGCTADSSPAADGVCGDRYSYRRISLCGESQRDSLEIK